MTKMTKNELIEEVLRLDGECPRCLELEWRINKMNGHISQLKYLGGYGEQAYKAKKKTQSKRETEKPKFSSTPLQDSGEDGQHSREENEKEVAAPDMARIIRDQRAQIDMLVEALDLIETIEGEASCGKSGVYKIAAKTLATIKSREWLEAPVQHNTKYEG